MSLKKYLTKEKAIIKDDYGRTLDTVTIKRGENTFIYGERQYTVVRYNIYYDEIKGLIFHTHRYFYNIGNSMPMSLNKTSGAFEPILDPKLLKTLMENEILLKLNSVNKNWLRNLNPKLIIAALLIIAAIIYFMKGGKLTT